jgi:integrase
VNLTAIKNAPEGAELRDDEVKGLQLRVRDGRKAFFLYYRTKTGQRRRPKIGDFPAITLQTARDIAREWLGEVARGKDPSGDRQSLRASETVSDLCDRYLVETKDRASHRHDKGRVANVIKPAWGSKRVAEISRPDLLALRREMRDTPIAFNRLLALISQLWKFGDYPAIVANVKRYPEAKRRRYLSEDERQRLLDAMDETEPQFPHAVALIRLLYLTGARRSELSTAKREWYKDGVLTLAKHKTAAKVGTRVIRFSQEAQDVVAGIDPRGGWLTGFSSNPWAAWELIRERAKLADFTLHDLRHSFASDALGAGFGLDAIGEVLGHKDAATTKRYAHLTGDRQQAVTEAVSAARKKAQ